MSKPEVQFYIVEVLCDDGDSQEFSGNTSEYCLGVLNKVSLGNTIVYLGSREKNAFRFVCGVSDFDELTLLHLRGIVRDIKHFRVYEKVYEK